MDLISKALEQTTISMLLLIGHVAIVSIVCKFAGTSIDGFLLILALSIYISAFVHNYFKLIKR